MVRDLPNVQVGRPAKQLALRRFAPAAVALGITAAMGAGAPGADARVVKGCEIKPRTNCSGKGMPGANLRGANLAGSVFYFSYMPSADLRGANLSGARMVGANLTGADLRGANLTGANLSFAKLTGAKMAGARTAGAVLTFARMPDGSTHR